MNSLREIPEKTFTEWLDHAPDCGLCEPPMQAQVAVDFLKKYLLGDTWYHTGIASTNAQLNTVIVFQILYKYSRKFRREYKKYLKRRK